MEVTHLNMYELQKKKYYIWIWRVSKNLWVEIKAFGLYGKTKIDKYLLVFSSITEITIVCITLK